MRCSTRFCGVLQNILKNPVTFCHFFLRGQLNDIGDGKTHDYTHKPGVVHTEIMLPAHAPPEFQDRSTLWSVEEIEKSSDAQLAREIKVALSVELSRAVHLALVRSFVKDNFVAAGMCADLALHDKCDGNPHAHIMLTIRLLQVQLWNISKRKNAINAPKNDGV